MNFQTGIIIFDTIWASALLLCSIMYFFGMNPVYSFMNSETDSTRALCGSLTFIVGGVLAGAALLFYILGIEPPDTAPGGSLPVFVFVLHMVVFAGWILVHILIVLARICSYIGGLHDQIITKRGLK